MIDFLSIINTSRNLTPFASATLRFNQTPDDKKSAAEYRRGLSQAAFQKLSRDQRLLHPDKKNLLNHGNLVLYFVINSEDAKPEDRKKLEQLLQITPDDKFDISLLFNKSDLDEHGAIDPADLAERIYIAVEKATGRKLRSFYALVNGKHREVTGNDNYSMEKYGPLSYEDLKKITLTKS